MIDTQKNLSAVIESEELDEIEALAHKTKVNRESILARSYRNVAFALLGITALLSVGIVILAIGWGNAQGKVTHEVDVVEIIKEVEVPAYTVIDPRNEYSHG